MYCLLNKFWRVDIFCSISHHVLNYSHAISCVSCVFAIKMYSIDLSAKLEKKKVFLNISLLFQENTIKKRPLLICCLLTIFWHSWSVWLLTLRRCISLSPVTFLSRIVNAIARAFYFQWQRLGQKFIEMFSKKIICDRKYQDYYVHLLIISNCLLLFQVSTCWWLWMKTSFRPWPRVKTFSWKEVATLSYSSDPKMNFSPNENEFWLFLVVTFELMKITSVGSGELMDQTLFLVLTYYNLDC